MPQRRPGPDDHARDRENDASGDGTGAVDATPDGHHLAAGYPSRPVARRCAAVLRQVLPGADVHVVEETDDGTALGPDRTLAVGVVIGAGLGLLLGVAFAFGRGGPAVSIAAVVGILIGTVIGAVAAVSSDPKPPRGEAGAGRSIVVVRADDPDTIARAAEVVAKTHPVSVRRR